jgi:hypothetical protein
MTRAGPTTSDRADEAQHAPGAADQAVIEICQSWPIGDRTSWTEALEWCRHWNKIVLARPTRLAESPDKGAPWLLEAAFPEVPDGVARKPPRALRTASQHERHSPASLPFNEDPNHGQA